MRIQFGITAVLIAALLAVPATNFASEDGWIALFNGEDTEGWVIQGMEKAGPKVEDGVLEVGGWDYWAVISEKEVHNFELKFDYKVDKRGNSGILIHTPKKEVYKHSFEIQINDDAGKDASDRTTGAIFGHVAPSKNANKPAGEWNTMHIKYVEPNITVVLNDETVIDGVDLSGIEDLKKTLDKGSIAIQRNDLKKAVYFKDIMLKPLD